MYKILSSFRPVILGFFLMETIVLLVVFISLTMVILGWYSNFSSKKIDIIKRGQAIFVASNALESIRMSGRVPERVDNYDGFKTFIEVKPYADLDNFAEVTVFVEIDDNTKGVGLSTGILHQQPLF